MRWTPTKNDLAETRMAYNTLHDPCGCLQEPDCGCNLDTTVFITLGYVVVKNNGDVVFNGHTLYNTRNTFEHGPIHISEGVK